MDEVSDQTPSDQAWLRFLRANNPGNAPEPTLRLAQLLQRICERRRA